MNYILISEEALLKIQKTLDLLLQKANEKVENTSPESFLTADQVMGILKISRKTFFNIRKKGLLSYVQINKSILVAKKDLDAYMAAHFIKSKLN